MVRVPYSLAGDSDKLRMYPYFVLLITDQCIDQFDLIQMSLSG